MKKIANFFYRRHLSFLSGMTAFVTLTALPACHDELLQERPISGDGSLHFCVQHAPADWIQLPPTKAAAGDTTCYAIKAQNDSMFLNVSVEPTTLPASQDSVLTRGTIVDTVNMYTQYQNIGAFGYSYSAGNWKSDLPAPNFMHDMTLTASKPNYILAGGAKLYLPGGKTNVRFFTYAPKGVQGTGEKFLTLPGVNDKVTAGSNPAPKYDYTVPTYAVNQVDLTFSHGVDADKSSGKVLVKMQHVLTAIRFKAAAGTAEMTVNNIEFVNVRYKGTYTPKSLESHGDNVYSYGWDVKPDVNQSMVVNKNGPKNGYIPANTKTATDILAADETFFMMPHTYTDADNASIVVTYTLKNGTQNKFTFPLKGQTWKAGSTVTYTLSKKPEAEMEFEVTAATDNLKSIPFGGANISFNVKARKGNNNVNYVIEYSDDGKSWTQVWNNNSAINDNLPITMFNSVKAVTTGQGYTQTLSVGEGIRRINNAAQETLAKAKHKGTQNSPHKLAGESGKESTANCYIVNAPGYYQFPVVPGNALKGGGVNSNVMNKYSNYAGANFVPGTVWINANRVELLWQDTQGLITNCHMVSSGAKRYINFTVPERNIAEGNAVIAVRDYKGDIMWSWHIWVTAESELVTVGSTSGNRDFLRVPIGFVQGGNLSRLGRNGHIRFRLADVKEGDLKEGKTVFTFDLKQNNGAQSSTYSRYLMYQWGRKDPVLMLAGTAQPEAVQLYNINNAPLPANELLGQKGATSSTSVADWIKSPKTPTSGINTRADLWNAAVTSGDITPNDKKNSTTKSIYDPSPKGFKIPPRPAFEGITNYAAEITTFSGIIILNPAPYPYAVPANMKRLSLPLSGFGVGTSSGIQVFGFGNASGFWTSTKQTNNRANMLYISVGNWNFGGSGKVDIYGISDRVSGIQEFTNVRSAAPILCVTGD